MRPALAPRKPVCYVVSMDDATLWQAFCAATLPGDRWNHTSHVRIAYLHLDRFEFDEAHLRMRAGILRLNAAHGLEETPRSGYHETMTRAWLCLVASLAPRGQHDSRAFCEAHPELLDKSLVSRFYETATIRSDRARATFVPPDRAPLPAGPELAQPGPLTRGRVHHVDLTVRDPVASRPFYEAVLGHMGYRLIRQDPKGLDFALAATANAPYISLGLVQARGPAAARQHDRGAPGLHHIAWHASSRQDVDALHALLLQRGATILDAPAEYPQYSPGYYAVFFADPDGLKLEFVHDPAPPT